MAKGIAGRHWFDLKWRFVSKLRHSRPEDMYAWHYEILNAVRLRVLK